MKYLKVTFLALFLLSGSLFAQDVSPEIFRSHTIELAKHPKITKTFSMIDEENNFHLYVNVSSFEEYYVEKPIEFTGHKIFFWKEGSLAFFNVEQEIRLVTVMQPAENVTVYEFISQVDQKRFLLQVRFVMRNEKWELADLKRSRIKMTKNERKFLH